MKLQHKLLMAGVVVSLTACSGLRDVDHKWCPPDQPVVEKPTAKTERINISADALFRFDKASSTDLLPAGKETLDKLANAISTGYVSVDRVDLVGHTDRLGSADYNYKLGLRRAETVKTYLQSRGVTAPINVGSAGKTQPISNCPGTKSTPALKECLQVDRRVSVEITGIKKGK